MAAPPRALSKDRGGVENWGGPPGGKTPTLRVAAQGRAGPRRWIAAAIGGYLNGENTLADELEDSFTDGILNLADRGVFSVNRWIRFSARGAHLAWRGQNRAKALPVKTPQTPPLRPALGVPP